MHAHGHARLRAGGVAVAPFGDGEELDDVARLRGPRDVVGRDGQDALARDVVEDTRVWNARLARIAALAAASYPSTSAVGSASA